MTNLLLTTFRFSERCSNLKLKPAAALLRAATWGVFVLLQNNTAWQQSFIPHGRINKRLSLYHEEFLTMWWSAHHRLFSLAALVSMVWGRSHVTWYPISRVSANENAKPFDKNHKLITVLISRSSKATTLIESFLASIRNGINSKCPDNR